MHILKQFLSFASDIFQLVGFSTEDIKKNNNEVLLLLLQTSVVDKIEQYSKEERETIIRGLQSTTDIKELEKILQSVFADESYGKLLQHNSRKILFGISEKVMNDLSSEKLEKLENLLLTVSKTFPLHTN